MKKAIVTGANGFVGKATVKALTDNNVEVIALVRNGDKKTDELKQLKNTTVVECSLNEYDKLNEKIAVGEYDCFYHFAWTGSAGEMRSDEELQLLNVKYSCEAVRMAAKLGCRKFIFASSVMEYEIAKLMHEEISPSPSSQYCTAKITANYMCRTLANRLGLIYHAGVISNIYGPGEYSPRLVNTTIRKLLAKEHVSFSPGEQLYDFIYITDAARMFAAIGEKGKNNKTYYIGNVEPRPLKEFLSEIGRIAAPDQVLGFGELPFNGVSLSYKEFDTGSVYNDTGFRIEVPFAEGIKLTAEWIRSEEKNNDGIQL